MYSKGNNNKISEIKLNRFKYQISDFVCDTAHGKHNKK